MPARDIATIERPETAPPRSAVTRASLTDFRDPAADRTFDRIEICMPMNPDRAEKLAPRPKAKAVFKPACHPPCNPRATAKTIAKPPAIGAMVLYCDAGTLGHLV